MTANDLDLLRHFTRDQSQDAFTALVQRHLDLVYCAALRQVRSPELAEEVAQCVFTDLARNAARMKPNTILTAWLYQVTRRTAIDVVRRESRRQLREQIAFEMNAMNATAADWTLIEPLLDEAMHALDDTDRTAVLLRYFENKSLREVGEALGTTDDAARKRVSRAVDCLRKFFTKHGVTVGVSGLTVIISANAVQAAPIGLAAAISASAATVGTTALFSATALIMKLLNTKFIATALIAVFLVGGGAYFLWEQRLRLNKIKPDDVAARTLTTDEILYGEMIAAYPIASEVLESHPTHVRWQERRSTLLQTGYIETRQISFPKAVMGNGAVRTFFDRFNANFRGVEVSVRGFNLDTPPIATVIARKTDFGRTGAIEQFIRNYDPDKQ